MIRIQQLKLPVTHTQEELEQKIRKTLKIGKHDLQEIELLRRSIDARKKSELKYVYQLDVKVKDENAVLRKVKNNQIVKAEKKPYVFPKSGEQPLVHRPVIIGSGPAGLFCAYVLAKHGYRPLVLERGESAEQRKKSVDAFWKTGVLNPESNVQFGEGGAGTFSDGKLNTLVKDPIGRGRHVLEVFCKCGAPSEILYDHKPHIGTDILTAVIRNLREEILRLGGKFMFETCMTELVCENGALTGLIVRDPHGERQIDTDIAILAPGHSARDTFEMLAQNALLMEPKPFAVGFRVEHPQRMINESQYGAEPDMEHLPVAPYKVTANFPGQRGVYSFCMCPGGYVVNASSETKHLAVNGMSYYRRDSENANSAIIVAVTPADFPGTDALSGVRFQRALERHAYELCDGRIPQQLYGDFKERRISDGYGDFTSCVKGAADFGALHELLTDDMNRCFVAGMEQFGKKLRGFDRADAILSGVESRTSSPLRIVRNEQLESSIRGLYPCGEGAGYAGGITSAAMDGIRVAEAVAGRYHP